MPSRLLAISPGNLATSADSELFVRNCRRLVDSGLEGILLREPLLMDRSLLAMAFELRGLGLDWIGIHDRAHLGASAEVDGVHLGFRSLPPRLVKTLVPPSCAVGFSAHASDDLRQVEADYVFYSPVHPPTSKRERGTPLGLEGLAAGCELSGRPPLWALGGITATNAAAALEAGADGIAVLGAIFQASDPAVAVQELARIARH